MSTEATEANEPNGSTPVDATQPADQSANVEAEHSSESDGPDSPEEMDRYECRACGYVYEPAQGDRKRKVPAGTPFTDLSLTWRCPVCGAKPAQFSNLGPIGSPSGFKENLGYGLGVNALTPGRKGFLIALGLVGLILFLLSFYGVE